MTPQPFRVFHSERARELLVAAIRAATAVGRRAEAIAAARAIERALQWYADGFGEFRQRLNLMGELRWAAVLPLTVWFAVDVVRWEVNVTRYRFVGRPRLPRSSSP
jgi:hypothetical protein